MAKKKPQKRLTRIARAEILATAKAKGWTAEQVAKRFGVSKWTVYGWRKAKSGTAKGARRGRKPGRPTGTSTSNSNLSTAALRDEIRAVLPGILREEIAAALSGMVGMRGGMKRRRRGGKK